MPEQHANLPLLYELHDLATTYGITPSQARELTATDIDAYQVAKEIQRLQNATKTR